MVLLVLLVWLVLPQSAMWRMVLVPRDHVRVSVYKCRSNYVK